MVLDRLFKNSKGEFVNIIDVIFGNKDSNNYIYTLAEAHAIDLIAKTIAKCEIQTFIKKDGKIIEDKGDLYWTLNVQPNYNESGTKFLYKLVTKLLTDKTALVIINKNLRENLLYVADSYNIDNKILKKKTFTDIVISDDEGNSMRINKTYNSDDTIYYSIKNKDLTTSSENFKIKTSKILKSVQNSFIKANTPKWRLNFPGNQPTMMDPKTGKSISYEEYKTKVTEGLLSEDEAIILLSQAFDLINLNKDSNKNLTDFEGTVKLIGDTVARKWNIPLDIFYGSKTEKSTGTNDFITLAVEPYFETLEDGFNTSLVGKHDFLQGEYAKFNKSNIIHRDVLESTTGIDKLIATGFSRNEINKLLGLPEIDEDWANKHYITKNYENTKGGVKEDE